MNSVSFNRQQALADGYTPGQINSYITSRQQQGVSLVDSTPQPQQQQPQQEQGNGFLDLLPLIGAVGGSFLPGLGTIAGGAVGAGAGALAKNLFDKKPGVDVGDIGKEALLGGAGGVVGKGVGFVAGKALDAFGGGLGKLAEGIGIKGLRLNPSQISGFQSKHGEDIAKFLASEGALGKDSAKIASEHIQPLQDQFNAIAKSSGLTASPDVFLKNIDEQAQRLIEAGGSANRAIADKLRNEALYVWQNDLSPAGFDISKVDALRRNFAGQVNWANPEKASIDYAMADALRKTTIDTADQAGATGTGGIGLKDIGIKLSKYRDLENAAVRQEALGRGNMPAGITKWLGFIAGAGAMGGAPGAMAGVGANAIINSPKFLQFASRGAAKAGEALSNGIEPTGAQTILGRSAAQGAIRAPFAGGDQNGPVIDGEIVPQADASGAQPDPQQENVRKLIGTLLLSKAKSSADVIAALNLINPNAQQKPLTATQQQSKANAESGLRALNLVEKTLQSDSLAPVKSRIPILSQKTPYASANREIADVLTRLRTGAALNESEVKFYQSQTPEPFDSPETIAYKLSLFRNLFNSIAHNQVPAGADTSIPAQQ